MRRLAVLPAAFMAVFAAAVVAFVLHAQAGSADAATWGVLTGALVIGVTVLIVAARAATAEARRAAERQASLLNTVTTGQNELQGMVVALERGMRVTLPQFTRQAPAESDGMGRVEHAIARTQFEAKAALARAAQLAQGTAPGSEERVEVFVNLARRLQSLVHRQITMLDGLENEVEDPELLKGLFNVDHLATRIRRHAENVAVLGGSISRRQWTRPVSLMEVLRSSIAEVEQYSRVKLVPPIEGSLRGHAVADVVHLLAELVENATAFSDPSTEVLLRAQRVTAGLAVEVEDRGLGISLEEQARLNSLLSEPDRHDLAKLLADGRIGLYVVSELARRHNIAVRLQSNIYGGIQAVLVLPHPLIGDEADEMSSQATVAANQHVPPAVSQRPPVQVEPEMRYVPPPLDTAQPMHQRQPMPRIQPMPQVQQMAAPTPAPQQPTPQSPGPVRHQAANRPGPYDEDPRTGRPPLPQRRAQEHIVPELRNAPTARMTGGMPQGEHDPGLMAAFQRGQRLADDVSADSPADDSR
ncbi:ATP-binding protein [Streptomyces sp. NPDC001848]|uniref:sensor histidine kinase n=1 Tax=Streptomyces sp. NPDC001848 TaxID=3364618 RepID=UPI0036C91124